MIFDIGHLLNLIYSNYTCKLRTIYYNIKSIRLGMVKITFVEEITHIKNIIFFVLSYPFRINNILLPEKLVTFLHYYFKFLDMPDITPTQNQLTVKVSSKTKITTSYRGFASIDQEIEREIAMQFFTHTHKSCFTQRNFLLKKEVL